MGMPYRNAKYYLLALFPIAMLAFWPGYLSQLGSAPMSFHAHGITATLWLALLTAQSWTIHRDQRQLHRSLGMLSLVLFPLFLAGGVSIFFGMGERYVAGVPFHAMYAPKLAWLDFVGVGAFAYFYFEALRQRRKVHPHSRFMIATVFPLLPPIFGRLFGAMPPLSVRGPADFHKLEYAFQASNLLAAAIAFTLAVRSGKHGRPFYIAGALMLLSAFLYQTVGNMPAWQQLYARTAAVPWEPFALAAGLAGIAIGYAGWVAGRRPVVPPGAVPA